jgi:hypothetical protein
MFSLLCVFFFSLEKGKVIKSIKRQKPPPAPCCFASGALFPIHELRWQVCMPAFLPTCLPTCLSTCLPACLPACLTSSLPAYLPGCLAACLPDSLPACLHACRPACLPAYLPVCLHGGGRIWIFAHGSFFPCRKKKRVIVSRWLSACSLAHCKKRLAIFPSPAGVSLSKLSLGGNY